MLKDLLAHHLSNGLADFAGLEITGSIPVKQELINAVIADTLANGLPTKAPSAASENPVAEPTNAKSSSLSLDRAALQALVQQLVKRAEITAENGAITLHFEVRR